MSGSTSASPSSVPRPDRTTRGTWRAVLPLLIPPVAWLASLGLSWAVQDFTCTASLTAGVAVPDAALFTVLMVLNIVLLLAIVASGLISARALRHGMRAGAPLMSFLGLCGIALAALFGFGVVMIAATPLVLEIC
jgi:hypothetical protein